MRKLRFMDYNMIRGTKRKPCFRYYIQHDMLHYAQTVLEAYNMMCGHHEQTALQVVPHDVWHHAQTALQVLQYDVWHYVQTAIQVLQHDVRHYVPNALQVYYSMMCGTMRTPPALQVL
jgi:hypothetical protein